MMHGALVLVLLAPSFSILSDPDPTSQAPPPTPLTLTVLFDNFSNGDRYQTGWGFAALLETPDHTLLFDTGADGEVLLENMRLLGKDPAHIEAIVISHAHSDHTGGLRALLSLGLQPKIFLLAAFPPQLKEELRRHSEVTEVEAGQEILPGILTTGLVGSSIPEQALILQSVEGSVVLTGCAHPGAPQMARRAQELVADPLDAVLGGFHLMEAGDEEIQSVIQEFRDLGIVKAGPTHCSGERAMGLFHDAYGHDFIQLGVGAVLSFELVEG